MAWIIEVELPQPYKPNYSNDGVVIIETPQSKVVQVEVGFAGPQGPKGDKGDKGDQGLPGSGVNVLPKVVVNPNSSEIVDSIAFNLFRSAKWMVTLKNDNKFRLFEVMALNNNIEVNHVSYGFIGDEIDVLIDIEKVGNDVVFSILNNELTNLDVDVVRVGLIYI